MSRLSNAVVKIVFLAVFIACAGCGQAGFSAEDPEPTIITPEFLLSHGFEKDNSSRLDNLYRLDDVTFKDAMQRLGFERSDLRRIPNGPASWTEPNHVCALYIVDIRNLGFVVSGAVGRGIGMDNTGFKDKDEDICELSVSLMQVQYEDRPPIEDAKERFRCNVDLTRPYRDRDSIVFSVIFTNDGNIPYTVDLSHCGAYIELASKPHAGYHVYFTDRSLGKPVTLLPKERLSFPLRSARVVAFGRPSQEWKNLDPANFAVRLGWTVQKDAVNGLYIIGDAEKKAVAPSPAARNPNS